MCAAAIHSAPTELKTLRFACGYKHCAPLELKTDFWLHFEVESTFFSSQKHYEKSNPGGRDARLCVARN